MSDCWLRFPLAILNFCTGRITHRFSEPRLFHCVGFFSCRKLWVCSASCSFLAYCEAGAPWITTVFQLSPGVCKQTFFVLRNKHQCSLCDLEAHGATLTSPLCLPASPLSSSFHGDAQHSDLSLSLAVTTGASACCCATSVPAGPPANFSPHFGAQGALLPRRLSQPVVGVRFPACSWERL